MERERELNLYIFFQSDKSDGDVGVIFFFQYRIIPQHIRDEYNSQGSSFDDGRDNDNKNNNNLENKLLKGMKVWSERDGREMSRKELVDAYIPSHVKKANKILTGYVEECNSHNNWKVWGEKTTIYWKKGRE